MEFMQRHNIHGAHFAVCASEEELRKSLGLFSLPVVVKADGLAAGKGVVVAGTKEEAAVAGSEKLSGKLPGVAFPPVVLEEHLKGGGPSFPGLSDRHRLAPLV